MKSIVQNSGGIGLCYWGTELVAFDDPESTTGSNFENIALFNFDNKVLPEAEVFTH